MGGDERERPSDGKASACLHGEKPENAGAVVVATAKTGTLHGRE